MAHDNLYDHYSPLSATEMNAVIEQAHVMRAQAIRGLFGTMFRGLRGALHMQGAGSATAAR